MEPDTTHELTDEDLASVYGGARSPRIEGITNSGGGILTLGFLEIGTIIKILSSSSGGMGGDGGGGGPTP